MNTILTGNIPFSRNKQYIKHLHILLNSIQSQSNQQLISERKSKNSQNRPKTTAISSITKQTLYPDLSPQNNGIIINKISEKVKYRTLSNFRKSISVERDKDERDEKGNKNLQQLKKQKMVNILSTPNMRKHLLQCRKNLQIHNKQKLKQNRLKSKNIQFDLRNNMIRNIKNEKDKSSLYTQLLPNKKVSNEPFEQYTKQYRSEQMMRNESQVLNRKQIYNNFHVNYSSELHVSKQKQKKQFLRKGSSLSKNILNSILRLKLVKYNDLENDPQKYIKNEQIMKMIKVYKGQYPYSVSPIKQKMQEKDKSQIKGVIKNSDKDLNNLGAWNNQVDEQDFRQPMRESQNDTRENVQQQN